MKILHSFAVRLTLSAVVVLKRWAQIDADSSGSVCCCDSARLQHLINQGGTTVVPSQHSHQSRDDSDMLIQWRHYSLYSHKCTGMERKTTHTGKSATGLDLLNQATAVTTRDSQNAGKRGYKASKKTTESLRVEKAFKTYISVIEWKLASDQEGILKA